MIAERKNGVYEEAGEDDVPLWDTVVNKESVNEELPPQLANALKAFPGTIIN
jgi:hypothetical protein